MQSTQNNDSTSDTPRSPIKIEIKEQKNGEQWVQVSTPHTPRSPKSPMESTQREITPTSPGYFPAASTTPTATKAKCPGAEYSWTACHEDECWTHRSDKDGAYYPQGPRSAAVNSGWETKPNPPTEPRKRHARHGWRQGTTVPHTTKWQTCYFDNCQTHENEKRKAGHWPRKQKGSARTQTIGEGGERTFEDFRSLEKKCEELMG